MKTKIFILIAIIFSGVCWYFANDLKGDFWYLLWLAPVPILLISLKLNGWQTFLISFTAYLIGRLSWFSYLVMVATLVPAIIFTILLPLIFALIVTFSRKIAVRTDSWLSVFALPVLFTTSEFFIFLFSTDGTGGSIAYSQANVIPLIQIASITGILGITFLVTFFPSAIVFCWYYRKNKKKLRSTAGISIVILVSSFLFGFIRTNNYSDETVKVGLVVLDEKYHNMSEHPDFAKEKLLAADYAKEIIAMAGQGVRYVVLPERAINLNGENDDDIIGIFSEAAIKKHVTIIIGITDYRDNKEHNSAIVIGDNGEVILDYRKVHLVTGFEKRFQPGNLIGLFNGSEIATGTAICKDLDYPGFIRQYGKKKTGVLFVPAWDFVVDDWLHSRMAILRSVEFGFSEVRAARQGRLTISDQYGKIIAESETTQGQKAEITGLVPFRNRNTLYTFMGEWFGFLNIIASISFVIFFFKSSRTSVSFR